MYDRSFQKYVFRIAVVHFGCYVYMALDWHNRVHHPAGAKMIEALVVGVFLTIGCLIMVILWEIWK